MGPGSAMVCLQRRLSLWFYVFLGMNNNWICVSGICTFMFLGSDECISLGPET